MLLLFSDLIVFLFSAPSRPPKIIGTKMNHSGTTINIAWEHVEPLTNESKVEGYKVSKNTVMLLMLHLPPTQWICFSVFTILDSWSYMLTCIWIAWAAVVWPHSVIRKQYIQYTSTKFKEGYIVEYDSLGIAHFGYHAYHAFYRILF